MIVAERLKAAAQLVRALALPVLFVVGGAQGIVAMKLASDERRGAAENARRHDLSQSHRRKLEQAIGDHEAEARVRWSMLSAEVDAVRERVEALEGRPR